jgi:hypothetical protein
MFRKWPSLWPPQFGPQLGHTSPVPILPGVMSAVIDLSGPSPVHDGFSGDALNAHGAWERVGGAWGRVPGWVRANQDTWRVLCRAWCCAEPVHASRHVQHLQ